VIELSDGQLREYDGNSSDYLRRRQEAELMAADSTIAASPVTTPAKKSKDQKRKEAEARQAIAKERKVLGAEIATLETRIDELESRKAEIEAELANPETYQDGKRTAALQREYAQLKTDLNASEERWETAQLELEALVDSIASTD
jgi:ATP-binding cassette subfamily F protein 3